MWRKPLLESVYLNDNPVSNDNDFKSAIKFCFEKRKIQIEPETDYTNSKKYNFQLEVQRRADRSITNEIIEIGTRKLEKKQRKIEHLKRKKDKLVEKIREVGMMIE